MDCSGLSKIHVDINFDGPVERKTWDYLVLHFDIGKETYF